jgi:S-adenosylhomocysteine hydrolase
MDYSYPLLNKIFDHYKQEKLDLSDFRLCSCQHLLGPQLEMYKMFIEFGFKPENIIVLGKAYSSNREVMQDLQNLGIKAFQPEFSGISFDIEHTKNCQDIIKEISDNDKNIILDDGAYLINTAKEKNIYFAVEQTSSGFRILENSKLDFPVFNVARSKIKLTQESPIIARIIFERVKTYIQDNNINSLKILIIGLGPIGNSVLQILNDEKYNVAGFDIETTKEEIISYLKNEKPDLVIGATGTAILEESDLVYLENEHVYHFISVSSSDREFPVVPFRKNKNVHNDVKHENFVFVNNGFPITFKGNRYESTPMEIEKTIGLLMGSVLHGIVRGFDNQNGIIDIPRELENIINVLKI